MSFLKNGFLILLMMFTLTGCNDLFTNTVIKRSLDTDQFSANCDLDVEQFKSIMHQNIRPQILCLGENLNLFIRVVKTTRPGYMNRAALVAYLKFNRPDIQPEMISALKAVYDLNYLITGDDPEFISKSNVDKIISFAVKFNQEASLNFGPIFEDDHKISYIVHKSHRDRVSAANKRIVQGLREIFNANSNGTPRKLNIMGLLNSFSTPEISDQIKKVEKLLFIKSVLIGGVREEITHEELGRLLLNFDHLVLLTLDAVKYKYIKLDQESTLELLQQDVASLTDVILAPSMGNREAEVFFTIPEVIDAIKTYIDLEDFDIDQYSSLILEAKKIIMGGDTSSDETMKIVRGADFKNLLTHSKTLLQTGTVFHRIWDKFQVALNSPQPVTVDFSDYSHTYPKHAEILKDFERIVKNYRFFRGEFVSAFYTSGYRRNADAVVEIAIYEYLLKLLFKTYGDASIGSLGGYAMENKHVLNVVGKIENELIDLGIILPQRKTSITDTVSLLGTLFQYQSDKNGKLDVNEATEFGLSLFTSLDMADSMMDYYNEKCPGDFDQFERVKPACFRQYFLHGVCDKYRVYYPLLFESLGAKTCEQLINNEYNMAYLDVSIKAARTCNYYTDTQGKPTDEIYYSKGDVFAILVAMMHIEATILRWDNPNGAKPGNNNNIMDANEVNNAYEIYSAALDGFLEGKPAIIKAFKKQIYQYLIKYEEIPNEKDFGSIWKFIKFLLNFDKKAPATRKTIASILYNINEQNTKIATDAGVKQFDCNYLKDPENIPRVPLQSSTSTANTSVGTDYSSILNVIKTDTSNGEDPIFYIEKTYCVSVFGRQYCL